MWTFTLKIDVMVFQSDSNHHLQSEQTEFNRQTGKHSLNSACICHLQILNNEVISEWKGNIEKNLSIFQRNPFDGDSPNSFKDLFARVLPKIQRKALSLVMPGILWK